MPPNHQCHKIVTWCSPNKLPCTHLHPHPNFAQLFSRNPYMCLPQIAYLSQHVTPVQCTTTSCHWNPTYISYPKSHIIEYIRGKGLEDPCCVVYPRSNISKSVCARFDIIGRITQTRYLGRSSCCIILKIDLEEGPPHKHSNAVEGRRGRLPPELSAVLWLMNGWRPLRPQQQFGLCLSLTHSWGCWSVTRACMWNLG